MAQGMRLAGRWGIAMVLTALVLAGLVFGALHLLRSKVVVSEAVVGPVVQAFYATGTVQPQREYPIKSNVAGILTAVLVDKGDHVKKGQTLATVSDPNLKYAYDKAKAELQEKTALADPKSSPSLAELDARIASQKVLVEIADREVQRQREMIAKNAASQTDLDRSMERKQAALAEAGALAAQRGAMVLALQRQVKVAQAAVDTARWNLDLETISSPIDGVVLDRPASVGTRLAINDHLMQIADVTPEHLVMRAAVDEEDRTKLRPDQLVQMVLYSFEGRALAGRVERIYDRADPERRTFEVDIRFTPAEPKLHPGMTGELAFIMETKDQAVVIPAQALQGEKVWVVRDGVVDVVKPKVGLKSVERVEMLDGVKAGDRVIISPAGDLDAGDRVRSTYEDPIKAAGLNKHTAVDTFKGFNR